MYQFQCPGTLIWCPGPPSYLAPQARQGSHTELTPAAVPRRTEVNSVTQIVGSHPSGESYLPHQDPQQSVGHCIIQLRGRPETKRQDFVYIDLALPLHAQQPSVIGTVRKAPCTSNLANTVPLRATTLLQAASTEV